ncbi:MAG: hypothetical protein AAFQ13_12885, partial [Pseudomonadota bacterium]
LIGHILRHAGMDARVGGNIGQGVLDMAALGHAAPELLDAHLSALFHAPDVPVFGFHPDADLRKLAGSFPQLGCFRRALHVIDLAAVGRMVFGRTPAKRRAISAVRSLLPLTMTCASTPAVPSGRLERQVAMRRSSLCAITTILALGMRARGVLTRQAFLQSPRR